MRSGPGDFLVGSVLSMLVSSSAVMGAPHFVAVGGRTRLDLGSLSVARHVSLAAMLMVFFAKRAV